MRGILALSLSNRTCPDDVSLSLFCPFLFFLLLFLLFFLRLLLRDTTETNRTFFNDALLLLLLLLVFCLRDFSGDVTLCVCVYNVCVCLVKNDDSLKNKVAAEFFFPSFVCFFEEKIFFEKKAKKHLRVVFFLEVFFFRCVE